MKGESPRLGDTSDPIERLYDQIVRLADLRRDGLRQVSAGDIEAVAAWHHRWDTLLNAIRKSLKCEAPRHSELILWPNVEGSQPLHQTREALVRASVGCRELDLLVGQLLGAGSSLLATSETMPPTAETSPVRRFLDSGRRFEGAVMLRRLIEAARFSLVIVDPYMTADTLTLAAAAPDGIQRRFLCSNHPRARKEVAIAWAEWSENWSGDSECRIGSELPHFRLLYVDTAAYHVDASLKDFGSKLSFYQMLPTDELQQLEGTIDSMWRQAIPL